MDEERQVIRLGRREGIAGDASTWQVRWHGRVFATDRDGLRRALRRGWLTGIEDVRRTDGDWGPLFGRPIYREVFGTSIEPRDHAKARAASRIGRLRTATRALLAGAGLALVLGLPFVAGPAWTPAALFAAALQAVLAGFARLLGAMDAHELASLRVKLVPPVGAPPPPVDWAKSAAEDEVESLLRGEG